MGQFMRVNGQMGNNKDKGGWWWNMGNFMKVNDFRITKMVWEEKLIKMVFIMKDNE